MFFFFKQKTAYEMRISDWSSDVCSSDLGDVCILNYGGHVELVASNNNGDIKLIGSNNINPDGSQQVSYGNPYGNAYYLSPPCAFASWQAAAPPHRHCLPARPPGPPAAGCARHRPFFFAARGAGGGAPT